MDAIAVKEPKNKLIDVEKIKRLCEEQNISVAELGRKIGLDSRELISRRLQNSYSITGDELILIAENLGVSVKDLCFL